MKPDQMHDPHRRMKEAHRSGDEGHEQFAKRKRTDDTGGGEHDLGEDLVFGQTPHERAHNYNPGYHSGKKGHGY